MSTSHEYMSRLIVLAITASLAMLFLLGPPVKADGQVFYVNQDRNIARGQQAMQDGDYERAAAYLKKAASRDLSPDHKVIVQNSLCASLFLAGDNEGAAEACSAAVEEDASYWKAFVNRGHARKALGDTAGALADYCAAHRLSPKNVRGAFESQCEG